MTVSLGRKFHIYCVIRFTVKNHFRAAAMVQPSSRERFRSVSVSRSTSDRSRSRSRAFSETNHESEKSNFVGFVHKPVRRQVLINTIREVMGIGEEKPKDAATKQRLKEVVSRDVRILYAEDNPVNYKLGEKILKRMGYQIQLVSNGREAVKFIQEGGPVDIVLMDIQMPEMDGITATKKIRNWESKLKNPNSQSLNPIPIIALTANAMKGDREKYLDAGMNDYLSKPFKKDDIQRMIKKWTHPVKTTNQSA